MRGAISLLVGLSSIAICDKKPDADPAEAAAAEGADDANTGGDDEAGEVAGILPLERAKRKLMFIGKDAEHLGWKMTSLAKLRGLAGGVEVPEWSGPSEGSLRAARDDDLRTAWTCEQTRETPCAFGIHFPEPAKVTALRLHTSPNTSGEPTGAHDPKGLRVHTDEGWAEANFEPSHEDIYFLLGEPVTTSNLTVEVLDVHGPSGQGKFRLAEFEIYGEGVARPRLEIDATALYTVTTKPAWKSKARTYRQTGSFIEHVGLDGVVQRIAPGTAAYGSSTGRFLLIESITRTNCKSNQGSYLLVDLDTRVRVPLGDLGGIPGEVFPAHADLGFIVGWVSEDLTRVHGVIWEDDVYQRKRSPRVTRDTYHEMFEQWGVSEAPLSRGLVGTFEEPPVDCQLGTPESMQTLQQAIAAKPEPEPTKPRRGRKPSKSRAGLGVPDRWMVCSLGEGVDAYLTSAGECGAAWDVVVVADGKVVARERAGRKGAHVAARRVTGGEIFVEVGGSDEATQVYSVRADAIESLGMHTSLALSPPTSCRKQCSDPFVNPRAE